MYLSLSHQSSNTLIINSINQSITVLLIHVSLPLSYINHQSISQSINHSINQSITVLLIHVSLPLSYINQINQSYMYLSLSATLIINQSVMYLSLSSINHSINQSITVLLIHVSLPLSYINHQSINHYINHQSINQSITVLLIHVSLPLSIAHTCISPSQLHLSSIYQSITVLLMSLPLSYINHQLFNQSINHCISYINHQLFNQSINQSINQSFTVPDPLHHAASPSSGEEPARLKIWDGDGNMVDEIGTIDVWVLLFIPAFVVVGVY